ncbi:MAG: hypothetical protein JJE21_09145 [Spirochaetaceae bacterium]|nr:hypothetical protein [Spirochaetaceae bacterium]
MKKIVYVDMDNVLVDFPSAFGKFTPEILEEYQKKDEIPGIFAKMEPLEGAIKAFKFLEENFEVYILSTAPWNNPSAWSDKLIWVKNNLGKLAKKRLILTHHKNLNMGDFLIDDRINNGASEFNGELIQFGSKEFPDWNNVIEYMKKQIN